jgi:hypothetical protein
MTFQRIIIHTFSYNEKICFSARQRRMRKKVITCLIFHFLMKALLAIHMADNEIFFVTSIITGNEVRLKKKKNKTQEGDGSKVIEKMQSLFHLIKDIRDKMKRLVEKTF